MSKTIKDIQKIKEKTLASFGNRIGNDDNKLYIMTCCGTGCTSSGAIKNREKLDELMERDGLQDRVQFVKTGCFGLCAEGPILMVYPENVMYTNVTPDDKMCIRDRSKCFDDGTGHSAKRHLFRRSVRDLRAGTD